MITVTQRLAAAFSVCLLEDIGPDNLAEAVRLNAASRAAGDLTSCASHNYCDANMTMERAFNQVFGRDSYMPSDWEEAGTCTEAQCNADLDLWNAAWTKAKRARFDAPAILAQ